MSLSTEYSSLSKKRRLFKGQIISKYLYGVFNFFQKRTKTSRILVKTNSFIRFLEESSAWQFAFKINWPLVEITFFRLFFVEIYRKVDWFCLIWGIYARFGKKMADSSPLIFSLILTLGHTYTTTNQTEHRIRLIGLLLFGYQLV